MILYTINGSGSDSVLALAKCLNIELEVRPRSEFRPALEAVNPRATVPTLVESQDTAITETATILRLLARRHGPELLGESEYIQTKVDELVGFMSTVVYQGYLLKFRPEFYTSVEAHYPAVGEKALQVLKSNLQSWEFFLTGSQYLVGDKLTIADFYAYVLLKWQSNIAPLNETDTPKLFHYWNTLKALEYFKK
ncbi:glutathione S-transferase family protein [Pseudoalteromonas xiamenensis]|uniref:glutathione S-transferase family protein n=1 Tax=Pseudoalteromonas xiamenensis TaxID=882626 RepID=UPI0027E55A0C|nr:glutathione S-transferase family protein [Pseudoalteromonas xiamenensis]WMN58786.1 glutathione S-transferase family protein [Pseudoalteromonas xiamenensis]